MDFTLHLFLKISAEKARIGIQFQAPHCTNPAPPPLPQPLQTLLITETDGYTVQIGADLANAFSKRFVFTLVKTKQIKIFLIKPCTSIFCHGFHLTCKQQVSKFSHAGF